MMGNCRNDRRSNEKARTGRAFKSLIYKALAEREGFEPSVRGYRTPDFESGTFDHSATSPDSVRVKPAIVAGFLLAQARSVSMPPM
jgi:hypothetical protein